MQNNIFKETIQAIPEVTLRDDENVVHIRIDLPNNCLLMGSISKENTTVAHIGVVFINQNIQGMGIAGKLMNEFIGIVRKHGVKIVAGYSTNINAIKAAAKIVGKENLKITKIESGEEIAFEEMIDENYHVEAYI